MFRLTAFTATASLITFTASADTVEVYVTDMLDNIQCGYCLDIAKGQGASANPDDGRQAHTCYSPTGEIFVDQAFDSEQFADGILYMPEFDVCVQAIAAETGASVELAACDGSDMQSWAFDGEGTIAPASATDLCLTLADDTRTGRSEENQMKALSLETCADDLAATQTWANRTVD